MMVVAKVSPELVIRNVTALSGWAGMFGLPLIRMFLSFGPHLVTGLVFAFLILFVLLCGFGLVLTRRFSFVLLGLGFFLPGRSIFLLLLVLRVNQGCTSDQQRQYRYI